MQSKLAALALLISQAAGHGWVLEPFSKNEMANQLKNSWIDGMPTDFRSEPQSSANGNLQGNMQNYPGASCGARPTGDDYARGLDLWQQWYDQSGFAVPVLTPGADMTVRAKITADHGGQAWMMIACGTQISENVNWTILERAQSDRDNNFVPSNPAMYPWRLGSAGGAIVAHFHVPSSFSCPSELAVGRWLWKAAQNCNDFNNVGRDTETFMPSEYSSQAPTCPRSNPPETFISCFDFRVTGPSSPTPAPVPTPAPPPTPAPTTPAPPPPTPPPPPAGPCRHQTDCSVSAWCNSPGYESWCQQQGAAGRCPSPQCTTAEAAAAAKKATFLNFHRH